MDSATRKAKLEELKANQFNQAMTGIPLRYKGSTRTEIVWRIPLDYLIYNKYNGRIGSDVLSYERQNGDLNAELDTDRAIIEKYLKCKELKRLGFSDEDIAGFMSEKPGQIKEWLRILSLMEEYLQEYDYEGIYTRLEKTEGPFVDLENYLDSYSKRGANVRNVDWTYTDSDISDLKLVCFDYIRARYEGKEFRDIAKTGKDGSIFFFKDLWDDFLKQHQEKTPADEETVDELRRRCPGEDLSLLLKQRDNAWVEQAKGQLKGNLNRFSRRLEDKRDANKPADLIERALSALQSVDCEQDSFTEDPRIEEMVREISKIAWEMKKILERR